MDDFVPIEIAKKLKDKGFQEECLCHYIDVDLVYNIESPIANNQLWFCHNKYDNIWHRDNIDAPTIEQALDWLRKNKEVDIVIEPIFSYDDNLNCIREYHCDIFAPQLNKPYHTSYYDSYVLAVLAGIEYVLDNFI